MPEVMTLEGKNQNESVNSFPIEALLDGLLPTRVDEKSDAKEERVLYEILDQVPNGRKAMNGLFYSKYGGNKKGGKTNYDTSKLREKSSRIAIQWLKVEKETSSQASSTALQIEAPVVFSWSQNSQSTNDSMTPNECMSKDTANSNATLMNASTTNNDLFKIASRRLREVSNGVNDWYESTQQKRAASKEEEVSASGESSWANSNFHVDPLLPFVAKALPKETKTNGATKLKSAKKRSLFGFWNSHRKREKEKGKHGEKGRSKKVEHKESPKHSVLGASPPKSVSFGPDNNGNKSSSTSREGRSEAVGSPLECQYNQVDFDFDKEVVKHERHQKHVKDEGPEWHQKYEEHGEQREHQQHQQHQQLQQRQQHENLADSDEQDDEFGDFEQASETADRILIHETINVPQTTSPLRYSSPELKHTHDDSPSMDSFIPLQPKKRPD